MGRQIINVNIGPKESLSLIEEKLKLEKKDITSYEVSPDRFVITAVYEKHYHIIGDVSTLVVTADNINSELTRVKMLSSGRPSDFVESEKPRGLIKKVNRVLKEYIIRE